MLTKSPIIHRYHYFHFHFLFHFLITMLRPSLYQILYIFIIFLDTDELILSTPSNETNFTRWSEDSYFESPLFIIPGFIFNQQPYQYATLRTRFNQWSLELAYENRSHLNKIWTELHIYVDYSTSLNNSIQGPIRNVCDRPLDSPITNDSNTNVPELSQMDQQIANYFPRDGLFRTIKYLHCRIYERRLDPSSQLQLDLYLVTNREFHSLLFLQMSDETHDLFTRNRARFYLHSHDKHFRYQFNISNMNYMTNSDTAVAYMIKLYTITRQSSGSMIRTCHFVLVLMNFLVCVYVFHF